MRVQIRDMRKGQLIRVVTMMGNEVMEGVVQRTHSVKLPDGVEWTVQVEDLDKTLHQIYSDRMYEFELMGPGVVEAPDEGGSDEFETDPEGVNIKFEEDGYGEYLFKQGDKSALVSGYEGMFQWKTEDGSSGFADSVEVAVAKARVTLALEEAESDENKSPAKSTASTPKREIKTVAITGDGPKKVVPRKANGSNQKLQTAPDKAKRAALQKKYSPEKETLSSDVIAALVSDVSDAALDSLTRQNAASEVKYEAIVLIQNKVREVLNEFANKKTKR